MEISRILQNLDLIENRAKQVENLNTAQRSVHQLPALFRPKKIRVLTNPTDPEHPTHGYFVGDDLQIGVGETPLEEMMHRVEEDMLSRTRRDLATYLDMLSSRDSEKKPSEFHTKNTDNDQVDEDPTETQPKQDPEQQANQQTNSQVVQMASTQSTGSPGVSGSIPVKSITMEDGVVFDIYGNVKEGYTVGCGKNRINRKFENLDHAVMATDIYRARRPKLLGNQDYIEER